MTDICEQSPKKCWRVRCNETNRCADKNGAYTEAEKQKALDNILEHFASEDRRHARRMCRIRIQGYVMRGTIIAVMAFFVLAPFFFL